MMKEIDIFNDESLQNDIRDLVAIEQGVIRANCPLPDLDAELEKIVGKAKPEKAAQEETTADGDAATMLKSSRRAMIKPLWGALAGAAAMLAVVLVWQWAQEKGMAGGDLYGMLAKDASAETATLQTADGEMITLTLADGTEVKLNANSKLTYPHRFEKGKERIVSLEGEAFFRVKHNAEAPFVVDAGGILTKDLGTTFNVKAYPSDECKVTLVEGSVAVLAKGADKAKPVVLTPGQQYSATQQTAMQPKVKSVDAEETTAWADGVYSYHDRTLEYVVGDLASHYQLGVDFRNRSAKTIHLDFASERSGTAEEAVRLLNDLGIAKVSVRAGKIVVE